MRSPDWARSIPAVPTSALQLCPGNHSSRRTSMWSATAFRWASSTTCRTPRSRTITPLFVRVEKPFTQRTLLAGLLHLLQGHHATRRSSAMPAASTAAKIRPRRTPSTCAPSAALASFDTRHRLVNTVVYQLPFGRNQKYLRYGLASKVLGGWETLRHRHAAIRLPLHA